MGRMLFGPAQNAAQILEYDLIMEWMAQCFILASRSSNFFLIVKYPLHYAFCITFTGIKVVVPCIYCALH